METGGADSEQELIFCFRDFMGSGNLILDHKLLTEHQSKQNGSFIVNKPPGSAKSWAGN